MKVHTQSPGGALTPRGMDTGGVTPMSVTDSTRSIPKPVKVETGIYQGEGRKGYRVHVSEGGKARWVVVPTLDKARALRRKVQAERQLARAKESGSRRPNGARSARPSRR